MIAIWDSYIPSKPRHDHKNDPDFLQVESFKLNQCVIIQHLFVILTVAFSQIVSTLFTHYRLLQINRLALQAFMTYRSLICDGVKQLSVHILSKYLTCIKIPGAPMIFWPHPQCSLWTFQRILSYNLRIPEPNPASSIKFDVKRDKRTGYIYLSRNFYL